MSDPTRVRLGLVGCGRIAQAYLDAIAGVPTAELCAVVDAHEPAALAAAERGACRAFTDPYDPALLAAVDAVIVCTPPATHAALTTHFLERDLHVLCEKPLTLDIASARRLVDLAAAQRRQLLMASKFRYVADVVQARAILESGALGRLVLFENTFCSKVDMGARWNSDRTVAGGGVLIDNGSHSVDIIRYLLGPIVSVQAQAAAKVQALDVEDTVRLQCQTDSGVLCCVDLSWSLYKEQDDYIAVYGENGTLRVGWKGSAWRQHGGAGWVPFGSGYAKAQAFAAQVANFCGAVQGREPPLITPDEVLDSVRVVEAGYRALAAASWVTVGR